jgi:magnesium-transporting ATPase (P-type)
MSIALAFEPIVPELMQQPPRPPEQPLLTGSLVRRVLVVSLFNWAVIYGLFFWSSHRHNDLALARTMAIQALVLAHLVYLVSISQLRRGLRDLPQGGWQAITHAPAMGLAIAGTLVVQTLFSQAQLLNSFFRTAPLNLEQLLICALPMLLMVPVAWLAEQLDPTTGKPGPATVRTSSLGHGAGV